MSFNEKARAGGAGGKDRTHAVYPTGGVAAIAHAMRLILLPGQVTELRALDVSTPAYRRPHVVSGFFDDVEKMAKAAVNIEGAKGIYFIPNRINPALLARANNRARPIDREPLTSDADITRRLWLLIDLDAKRPAGISSTEGEHGAAIERARTIRDALAGEGWSPPILADSGNGAHLLYSIDLPIDDGGLVQRCLQALEFRFGDAVVCVDENVFNPARIWKLYGTWARKGDSTPDRPHRLTRILEAPGELEPVPVELLEALAATLPKEDGKPIAKIGSRQVGHNGTPFDLEKWMCQHCPDATGPMPYQGGSKWIFDTCPWNSAHTNRSAFVRQDASGMIGAGCHHNGCAGKGWRELRELLEPGAYSGGSDSIGSGFKRERAGQRSPVAACDAPRQRPIPSIVGSMTDFPIHCLPEPIRSHIIEGADALDCDQRFLALPSIAAVAGAIGNTRTILLKKTWREPAVVWCGTVGESGTLKTPAMKLVMEPIYRRQRKLFKQYAAEMAVYQSELKAWKSTPKADRDDEPEPPAPCQHIFVSDVTVEGLADRMADWPRGILVAVDELSGLFVRFDRYAAGGGDVQHYLEMFSAGTLKVDRKGTERKTVFVSHAAVSICGTVQPAILREVLSQQYFDCGLAARLLLAWPEPRPAKWSDRVVSDGTLNAIDKVFNNLFELKGQTDIDGDTYPADVHLADDAQERFIEYVDVHAVKAVDLHGADAAAWSKLKGYAARFALIHHLVRQAAGEDVDPWTADMASVEAGIELSGWFWDECQRIYRSFRETPEDRERRELLELVYKLGGRVTPRQIKEHCFRYKTSEAAEVALNDLEAKSYGVWQVVPTGGRGRPPTIFVLADSPDYPAHSIPVNQNSPRKTHLVEWNDSGTGKEMRSVEAGLAGEGGIE